MSEEGPAARRVRDPRTFESVRAGPVFRVDVYTTVGKAATNERLILVLYPHGYRARGQISSAREANVRVVYASGSPREKARVRAALAALR